MNRYIFSIFLLLIVFIVLTLCLYFGSPSLLQAYGWCPHQDLGRSRATKGGLHCSISSKTCCIFNVSSKGKFRNAKQQMLIITPFFAPLPGEFLIIIKLFGKRKCFLLYTNKNRAFRDLYYYCLSLILFN